MQRVLEMKRIFKDSRPSDDYRKNSNTSYVESANSVGVGIGLKRTSSMIAYKGVVNNISSIKIEEQYKTQAHN